MSLLKWIISQYAVLYTCTVKISHQNLCSCLYEKTIPLWITYYIMLKIKGYIFSQRQVPVAQNYYFAVHIVTFTNNMHLQCLKWTVAKCDKHLIRATKSCSKLGSHWPNKNVWATIMPFGPVTLIFTGPKKTNLAGPHFRHWSITL